MIDWLIALLFPVSLILTVLLVCHKKLLAWLGARTMYALWGIMPLSILVYSLPMGWQEEARVNNVSIQSYLVQPTQELQRMADINWLGAIWLAVAICIIGYLLLSHWSLSHRISMTRALDVKIKTQLPPGLNLYYSSHAYGPMLVGVFRQKLVLPEDFKEIYTSKQQGLILEHEICHFQRKDMYWNLLALLCLTLFWFHPLAWLAYARYRRDQELACDRVVLARKHLDSKLDYGRALLVAAETSPPLAFANISFKKYGDKDIMFERIKNIKHGRNSSRTAVTLVSCMAFGLLSSLSYAGSHFNAESASKKAYAMQEKTGLPYPVYRVEPIYPQEAVANNIEGSVVLKFDIAGDGSVDNIKVVNAKPKKVFERSAKLALKQWQYSAPGETVRDNLVQLDFAMGENSKLENLVERIKVSH